MTDRTKDALWCAAEWCVLAVFWLALVTTVVLIVDGLVHLAGHI